MAINRTRAGLLVWALQLVLVGTAYADQPGTPQAGGVAEAPFVDDVQIFSPGDFSTYGSGPPRNQGWFGSWEALRFGISVPNKTDIGNPYVSGAFNDGTIPGVQPNSLNTGILTTGYEAGYRWEGGFVNGESGWLFNAFRLYPNNQRFSFNDVGMKFDSVIDPFSGASMLQGFTDYNQDGFDDNYNQNFFQGTLFDPPALISSFPVGTFPAGTVAVFGRDGADTNGDGVPDAATFADLGDLRIFNVLFGNAFIVNHTEIWGTEANRLLRVQPAVFGGAWDVFGGIRYLKFDERFNVNANGGILDASFWNTRANNNLVGPQVGVRGLWRRGRLNLTTEGRFFAAANLQQLTQFSTIATASQPGTPSSAQPRPWLLAPTFANHASRQTEFSAVGELRIGAGWQIFRSVQLTAGWTGMILGNIARPSNMIDYTLPYIGILEDNNRQEVFMHGLTLGVQVNR